MFKNLRGLKLIPKKKQQTESAPKQEGKKTKPPRPKTRPKVTALQKIKETMGNLTPSMFHGQHYVENIEEHAAQIMAELDRMRHSGAFCDVTMAKCDGTKIQAHKIVVSFNEKFLELTSETEAVGNGFKNDSYVTESEKDQEKSNENNAEVSTSLENGESELNRLTSVTSEGDLVKGLNGDDVIKEKILCPTDPAVLCEKMKPEAQEMPAPDDAEKEQNGVTADDDETIQKTQCSGDVVNGEDLGAKNKKREEKIVEELKEGGVESGSQLPALTEDLTPLINAVKEKNKKEAEAFSEVNNDNNTQATPPTIAQKENSQVCDVTIDEVDVICPISFEDPLEVLTNFFYTSHINITTKNVIKLRVVAQQCDMNDVTIACNEFENVLQTETESMSSDEKNKAEAQFRYQYSDPQMAVRMLEHFEKLRHHSLHTDVTVASPSTSFTYPSHSALLAAASKFFADAFAAPDDMVVKTDVTVNGHDVMKEVKGPDVKNASLQGMLSYFYTARIPVSSSTAGSLMEVADVMQCRDVVEGCAEFLEGTISVQSSIGIYNTATKYRCEKLKEIVTRFIESNFFAVSRTNDFLTTTKEWIIDIVSSGRLAAEFPASESEYHIFEAVKKWVNFDLENRKEEVDLVMAFVRFPLISDARLINDVSTDLLIMENDALCDRVSTIITGKSTCNFGEDVSMRGSEFIVMIGGSAPVVDETSDDQGYTAVAFNNYVTMYDVTNERMQELTYLPETRSLHCALAVDHCIIVAGGFDNYSCITNEVHCLDLATVSWSKLPPMKVKRACFAVAYINGCIYAAGGLTPTGYSSKVERFNRRRAKWENVAQLPRTYYRHAGCVYQGAFLITGGNDKCADSLSYTPSEDKWRMLKPMLHGRDSHAMATALDKVYVMGGDNSIFTVEEYNSTSECWQLLRSVYLDPVYLSGVTTFKDQIFLIGGWKGDDDALNDVKCFDPSTEEWLPTTMSLPFPRGSLSATTVRMPRSYYGKTVPVTQKTQS